MKTSTAIKLPYNSEYNISPGLIQVSSIFWWVYTKGGGGGLYTEPLLHLLFVSQERVME